MEHPPDLVDQDAARVFRRDGFTLIEVLIVVTIMAVLAGTVITYSCLSTIDAKQSSLKHNLYVMKSQIELYRADHLGQFPSLQGNSLWQLLGATNSSGEVGISGPDYPYGPYFVESPTNPYDGRSRVAGVLTPGQPPTAVADDLGGWQYDASNGAVWPNNPQAYSSTSSGSSTSGTTSPTTW
jgi:general secretion pathway protein G